MRTISCKHILQALVCFGAFFSIEGTDVEIRTGSAQGKRLMSKARFLENGNEVDFSFVSDYAIKYQGCHHQLAFAGEGEEGAAEGAFIMKKQYVRFRLCPIATCGRCARNYGEYIVDMNIFLETYLKTKEETQRTICENARYQCGCEEGDRDDDGYVDDRYEYNCNYECYKKQKLSQCIEELEREEYEQKYGRNENEFRVEEANECREFGARRRLERGLADNYYGNYFFGPYCSKQGGNIFLGLFTDETCTTFADKNKGADLYSALTFGETMPYKSKSLVQNDCISCLQLKEADKDDDSIEVNEGCVEVYEQAGKCEANMNVQYPVDSGCSFITGLKQLSNKGVPRTGSPALSFFTAVFAITFIGMGIYAYYLQMKMKLVQ